MLPNHSRFGAIAEEHFLEGTRLLLSSLEKINIILLQREFHKDCRRSLEDLVSTIFSTVAAHYPVGQGLSCFVLKISLEVMTIQLYTSSGNYLLGCVNLSGLGVQKLNLKRLISTLSSANSDRWKRVAIGLACQSIASLRSATSLASVLGGVCTKLVLWCSEIISMFSWFNTCVAIRSSSWQH